MGILTDLCLGGVGILLFCGIVFLAHHVGYRSIQPDDE